MSTKHYIPGGQTPGTSECPLSNIPGGQTPWYTQVTGKQHNHLMRDIRKMEPAWEKVNGSKFGLVDYRDAKGELRPCYSLTKTECLYVATKFNDEARAKLVLRWKELEEQEQKRQAQPMSDMEVLCRAVLISDKRIKELTAMVEEMAPKADYCDEVLDSVSCFTMTQVAKELEMSVHELTRMLMERKVIYYQSGQYMLYVDYAHRGYAKNRSHSYRDLLDELHTKTYLVWTERGRKFIHDLVRNQPQIADVGKEPQITQITQIISCIKSTEGTVSLCSDGHKKNRPLCVQSTRGGKRGESFKIQTIKS